jgi:signal transduction histidine kinase
MLDTMISQILENMRQELGSRESGQIESGSIKSGPVVDNNAFELLANFLDQAIVVVDCNHIVRYANKAAEQLFANKQAGLVDQAFCLKIATESVQMRTRKHKKANGEQVLITMSVLPTFWHGGSAWLVLAKPVAPVPLTSPLLTDAANSGLLESVRKRFLAHLSHELRTPLNTVIGFSEAIADEIYGPIANQRYRSYASDIHKAGAKLLGLLTDLLDISSAQEGSWALEESDFDVAQLITELAQACQAASRTQGAYLEIDRLPCVRIRADQAKLERALRHVFNNAFAFTSKYGLVRIQASLSPDGHLLIRVRDTGRGMSPQEIQAAFEPFGRVRDVEQADPQAGPGVGLALVRQVFELHDGYVLLESRQNYGTSLTCILPRTRILSVQKNGVALSARVSAIGQVECRV